MTIPFKATSIGVSAFEGCSGVTTVKIPDGVATIGEKAFKDCSLLSKMEILNK